MGNTDYFDVAILHYRSRTNEACARVRYMTPKEDRVKWLDIILDKASLIALDLREGDYFKWIPQRDGVVKREHIREHPRISDPDEDERTRRVFDDLKSLAERIQR